MNEKRGKRGVTPDEAAEILGGELSVEVRTSDLNPLTMKFLPQRVAARLASTGGRPTDPAWTIRKSIPMKQSTWDELERLADELSKERSVSAGQLAAIALERGLPHLLDEE